MRSINGYFAILLLMLLASGCTLTQAPDNPKPEPDHKRDVSLDRAPAAEIFLALAHDVEAGVIETVFELAQYIKALRDSGDLSAADSTAFDTAFPGAPSDHRALDKVSDSAKLKGIK